MRYRAASPTELATLVDLSRLVILESPYRLGDREPVTVTIVNAADDGLVLSCVATTATSCTMARSACPAPCSAP